MRKASEKLAVEDAKYRKKVERNIKRHIDRFISTAPAVQDTINDKTVWTGTKPAGKKLPAIEITNDIIKLGSGKKEPFVKRGISNTVIVVDRQASELEMLVASELSKYIGLITGAKLRIIRDNKKISQQYKIAVGTASPGKKVIPQKEVKNIHPEGFLIRSKDGILAIAGGSDVGSQYGIYHFLELLGIRFLHPRDEFIPKKRTILLGRMDIREEPLFNIRGIHLHPAIAGLGKIYPGLNTKIHHTHEYGSPFLQMSRHKDTKALKEILEWLAKNKQNFCDVFYPEDINPAPKKENLVDYGKLRGIKFCTHHSLHVAYAKQKKSEQGIKRYAYWARGVVIPLEQENKIMEEYGKLIDKFTRNGMDYIYLDPGGGESRNIIQTTKGEEPLITGTLKRLEIFRQVHKEKKSPLKIIAGVHGSKAKLFMLEVMRQQPSGVIRCVHTMMPLDMFSTTHGSYDLENYGYHREVIKKELQKRRKYLHFPESSYATTIDIDIPLWQPYYIYSLWLDMVKLAQWGAEGSFTYTQGNEWQYWLNNYAAFNLQWNPIKNHWTETIYKYASIYGKPAGDKISRALYRLMDVWDRIYSDRGRHVCEGFNLGLFTTIGWYATFFQDLNKTLGARNAETPDVKENNLAMWKKNFFNPISESAEKLKRIYAEISRQKKNIPENAKTFYEELTDCVEINYKQFEHLRLLGKVILLSKTGRTSQAYRIFNEAESLTTEMRNKTVKRREKEYRYPGYFRISFPEDNAEAGWVWWLQDRYVKEGFLTQEVKNGQAENI